jgi:tetratricopeptide (TPR) repeat protein
MSDCGESEDNNKRIKIISIYSEVNKCWNACDYDGMIRLLEKGIELGDRLCLIDLAIYYHSIKQYELMYKYYKIGVEKKCLKCMEILSYHHKEIGQTNLMIYYNEMILQTIDEKSYDKITVTDDAAWLFYIQAMNQLIAHYQEIKNYDKLICLYKMGITHGDVMSYINLGNQYFFMKDYSNMITIFDQCIELYKEPSAMIGLGRYYEQIKEYDDAIKYYLMVLEDRNGQQITKEIYLTAICNLANLYEIMNNLEDAIKIYLIGIEIKHSIFCMISLARLYNRIKNYSKMIYYYLMAINSDHDGENADLNILFEYVTVISGLGIMGIDDCVEQIHKIYADEDMRNSYIIFLRTRILQRQNEFVINDVYINLIDMSCKGCKKNGSIDQNGYDICMFLCGHQYCLECFEKQINHNNAKCLCCNTLLC